MKKKKIARFLSIFMIFGLIFSFTQKPETVKADTLSGNVVQVACGAYHTIFLKNDGTVWVTGWNSSGQLGLGDTTNRTSPVQVTGINNVKRVACGNFHTIFLKNDGTAWAVGEGNYGQLGIGDSQRKTSITQIPGLNNIAQVYCGGQYTVFLKNDGTVYTTGDNTYGQLGLGDKTKRTSPVQITGLSNIVQVICGSTYTVFLKNDGTAYGTGDNAMGELGLGDTTQRTSPVQISSLSNISKIFTGYSYTIFLKNDGTVWGTGYNSYGQLGLGDTTCRNIPTQIASLSNIVQVGCSETDTIFLQGDGTAWGTGRNDYGQLGLGDTTQRTSPTQIIGITYAAQAGCGVSYIVMLGKDGTAWSAGYNNYGQLGVGDTTNRNMFTQVTTFVKSTISQASCGSRCCVFTDSNGTTLTRGDNTYGQLGVGDNSPMDRFNNIGQINLKQTACGANFNMFLKNDGTVYVTGDNTDGQLGLGDTTERDRLTNIATLSNITQVACGYCHTIFLKNDGTVWATGCNSNGQLGLGDTIERDSPVQISSLSNVTKIACGGDISTFIESDGTVWVTGNNNYGQLGLGDNTSRSTPTKIASLSNITQVSIGGGLNFKLQCLSSYQTIFLKNDGTVYGTGYNYNGELGLGDTTNRNSPTQITSLSGITQVACCLSGTTFLKSDGTVWATGKNSNGQIGLGSGTSVNVPTKVTVLNNISWIASGYNDTIYHENNGSTYVTGYNTYDELGFGSVSTKYIPIPMKDISGGSIINASITINVYYPSDGSRYDSGSSIPIDVYYSDIYEYHDVSVEYIITNQDNYMYMGFIGYNSTSSNQQNITSTTPSLNAKGIYTIKLMIKNTSGTVITQSLKTIKIGSLPTLSLSSPSAGNWYSKSTGHNTINVQGTMKGDLNGKTATIEYSIEGVSGWQNKTLCTIVEDTTVQAYSGTITIDSSVPDGSYNLDVWAVDDIGNSLTSTVSIKIDSTSPGIPAINLSTTNWTNSNVTFTITNGTDSGSGVLKSQYRLNGGTWTDYSTTVTISAEGVTTIDAQTLDVAGNISASSTTTVKIDKSVQSAPTINPSTTAWTNGNVTFTITNGTDSGSGVLKSQYRLNGGTWTDYSTTVTISTEGVTTIDAQTIDNAGNISSIVTKQAKIDLTKPTSPTIAPSTTAWTSSNVTFTITNGTDSGSGVLKSQYRLNGGTWTDYSTTVTISAEGVTTIDAQTLDVAGNISASSTTTVKIDKSVQSAPTINPSTTAWTNGNVTFTLTGGSDTLSGIASLQYQIDSGSWTAYSTTVTVSTEGTHTINARTVDNAGNISSSSTATIKIDLTKPTGSLTAPSNVTNRNNISITFTGLGDILSKGINVRLSNSSSFSDNPSWTSVADGTTSKILTITLPTGYTTHTVYGQIKDAAGNILSVNVSIKYDAQLPNTPTILGPSSDTLFVDTELPVISWNYSDPNSDPSSLPQSKAVITLTNTNTSEQSTVTSSGTGTSCSLTGIAYGNYSVTITVYNTDNKVSSASAPIIMRFNYYKASGTLKTGTISFGSPIKDIEIITTANIPAGTSLSCTLYYPNDSGTFDESHKMSIPIDSTLDYAKTVTIPVSGGASSIKLKYDMTTADAYKTPKVSDFNIYAR